MIATGRGLDFEALQQRIHPAASRVRLLAGQTGVCSSIVQSVRSLGGADRWRMRGEQLWVGLSSRT